VKAPKHLIEVFLQPAECYFGDEHTRIRTILGSCVSVTAWHPQKRVGFMCHYMLASRPAAKDKKLDATYAEDAIATFLREADRSVTDPKDYTIKIFGGGNMFPKNRSCQPAPSGCLGDNCSSVSCKNVIFGRDILKRHGLKISAEHVGGSGHRQIIFDIWSGDVWMRQISIP
jgi:chemotaxis protein CheD